LALKVDFRLNAAPIVPVSLVATSCAVFAFSTSLSARRYARDYLHLAGAYACIQQLTVLIHRNEMTHPFLQLRNAFELRFNLNLRVRITNGMLGLSNPAF